MANQQSSTTAARDAGGEQGKRAAAPMPEEQSKLADELKAMEWEPLLPVEKKLIVWSIGLGVVLTGILYGVSRYFISAGH